MQRVGELQVGLVAEHSGVIRSRAYLIRLIRAWIHNRRDDPRQSAVDRIRRAKIGCECKEPWSAVSKAAVLLAGIEEHAHAASQNRFPTSLIAKGVGRSQTWSKVS